MPRVPRGPQGRWGSQIGAAGQPLGASGNLWDPEKGPGQPRGAGGNTGAPGRHEGCWVVLVESPKGQSALAQVAQLPLMACGPRHVGMGGSQRQTCPSLEK